MADTGAESYAERLVTLQRTWWKRLPVQAPHRWNLRRQKLGRTLEIGCGIGRNLKTLGPDLVGVDHNPASVAVAREQGFVALTVEEWQTSTLRQTETFDGLLMAHVLEHLDEAGCAMLLDFYLPYLKPGGKVFLVCLQEKGYASDPTHVGLLVGDGLVQLVKRAGLKPQPWFSFPLPRWAGTAFTYNEFRLLATKP